MSGHPVVGADPQTDVALLAVTGGDLQLAELGSSSALRIGQTVVAVARTRSVHYTVGINVVSDRDVMIDAGTGIVHQAPAFGEDDYQVGLREGLPYDDDVACAKEVFELSEPPTLLGPVGLTPAKLEQQLRGPETDYEARFMEALSASANASVRARAVSLSPATVRFPARIPRASGLHGITATPWSTHCGIISRSSSR
jgi:hypothetical protein